MRRGPVVLALVIGLGLAAAPAIFQMFSRAPKGGDMIDEFRPYMTETKVGTFKGYMAEIDRADEEVRARVRPALARTLEVDDAEVGRRFPALDDLNQRWDGIDADMGDMLDTMDESLDNFAAVDALPPFSLFPWFFVLPGLLVAGLAAFALRSDRRNRSPNGPLIALAIMGLGIVAAPAIFQMFTRAPKGGEMIDDFRSLMTTQKVSTIQGYFLVMGAGEGELRNAALPTLSAGPTGESAPFEAVDAFVADWPRISSEMAPMIGAMSDNVDNFGAVDALPPFPLFPWFFVAPGLLVAGAALFARPRARPVPIPVAARAER
jgi:hypothetical protein